LAQLGNKVQHALRSYTPNDQKAIKAAAASFRPNPEFNSETAISELSTGEALISALDEKGAPQMIQRGFLLPPRCNFGVAEPELIDQITHSSPLFAKYSQSFDRYSAYESIDDMAKRQTQQQMQEAPGPQGFREIKQGGQKEIQQSQKAKPAAKPKASKKSSSAFDKALSSSMSQIGRSVSRELVQGLFDTFKK
jgi:hypothetical protein